MAAQGDGESGHDATALSVRVTQHASECLDLPDDLTGLPRAGVRGAPLSARWR